MAGPKQRRIEYLNRVHAMRNGGMTFAAISDEFGVSVAAIHNVYGEACDFHKLKHPPYDNDVLLADTIASVRAKNCFVHTGYVLLNNPDRRTQKMVVTVGDFRKTDRRTMLSWPQFGKTTLRECEALFGRCLPDTAGQLSMFY
jgi:hypothetical protein